MFDTLIAIASAITGYFSTVTILYYKAKVHYGRAAWLFTAGADIAARIELARADIMVQRARRMLLHRGTGDTL